VNLKNRKVWGEESAFRPAATFIVAVVFLVVSAAAAAAADPDCPRSCEVWAFGLKSDPRSTRYVEDPSFTTGEFLKHFGRLFQGSGLQLGAKDKPEYSVTATFYKIDGFGKEGPTSHLTIAFSFNEGIKGTASPSIFMCYKTNGCLYQGELLKAWSSDVSGHNLADHVPPMAAQINGGALKELIKKFEQIPVKAYQRQEASPFWCNMEYHPDRQISIYYGLKAAAGKDQTLDYHHQVRIIVRAEKGTILWGTPLDGDDKAKVFHLFASDIEGDDRHEIVYVPPNDTDKSDTITLYNSCEIRNPSVVPLEQTQKKQKLLEIENECGWEGTLTMSESLEAAEKQSLLSSIMPGTHYDMSRNWRIEFVLERKAEAAGRTRNESGEARLLSFDDLMDATVTKMQNEGRVIDLRTTEKAEARGRKLTKSEFDLALIVDQKKGTYRLIGKITIEGIPIKGRDEMDIKSKPVDKEIRESADGTMEISENIDISGKFEQKAPEYVPEELKGRIDYLEAAGAEFKEFIEKLGGKQTMVMSWEMKRKATRVTAY
jgi:hypothetical protein